LKIYITAPSYDLDLKLKYAKLFESWGHSIPNRSLLADRPNPEIEISDELKRKRAERDLDTLKDSDCLAIFSDDENGLLPVHRLELVCFQVGVMLAQEKPVLAVGVRLGYFNHLPGIQYIPNPSFMDNDGQYFLQDIAYAYDIAPTEPPSLARKPE